MSRIVPCYIPVEQDVKNILKKLKGVKTYSEFLRLLLSTQMKNNENHSQTALKN